MRRRTRRDASPYRGGKQSLEGLVRRFGYGYLVETLGEIAADERDVRVSHVLSQVGRSLRREGH